VSGIKKSDLVEIKNLPRAPDNVRLALEPVIALIKNQPVKMEWKDIRKEVGADGFVTQIINFDKDQILPNVKKFI